MDTHIYKMGDDDDDNNNNMMTKLPPGFRFCPTDQELVLHFLYRKALLLPTHPTIPHLNLRHLDPWQLNGRALSCGNVHYFFAKVTDSKATENGYWKELDIDDHHLHHQQYIHTSPGNRAGLKMYYVFCVGVHPTGTETRWVMEEYRISNTAAFTASTAPSYKRRRKHELNCNKWVLCRVHERKRSSSDPSDEQAFCYGDDDDNGTELSCLDEMFFSLDDDLEEISLQIN